MKKRNIVVATAVAVLLAACIPSVHPYYTEKDVVFEPRLLGEWEDKEKTDQPEAWKFEAGKDKAYNLLVTEKEGKRGEFEARLFKLKEEYFLDIVPSDVHFETNQAELVAASMMTGHLLLRVPQMEPELKLAMFDFDWLEKYLKEHLKALAHHRENDRIVLTAETADLQSFVLKHLGEGELFAKPGEMVRKNRKPTSSEPAISK